MIRTTATAALHRSRNRVQALNWTPWRRVGAQFGMFCLHIVNLGCAIHLCADYLGKVSFMEGPSMLPTLATHGEIVFEDRLTPRLYPGCFTRGELVVLTSPIMPERVICKRVLGLPGDIVCVDPTGDKAPSTEHLVVPKGHLWIIGDNAPYSRDSRDYGPVSMSLVLSKLRMRLYPKPTFFRNPTTYID